MCKGYAVRLIRQGLMNCFWLLRKETAVKGDLSRGGDFLFHFKGSGERNLCGKVEMNGKSPENIYEIFFFFIFKKSYMNIMKALHSNH